MSANHKKITDNEAKIATGESEIAKSQPKIDELIELLDSHTKAVESVEVDLSKREAKIFKEFSKRVGVANIREFENERLKLAEQYHNEKVRLTTEKSNLTNQLDYERGRDLVKSIDQAQKRLAAIQAQIADTKKEEAKIEAEIEKDRAKVEELVEESKKIDKEMEQKMAELKEAKKQGHTRQTIHPQRWLTAVPVPHADSFLSLLFVFLVQPLTSRMKCSPSTSIAALFAV